VVPELLVKEMKPFSVGEIIKQCTEEAADVTFPNKTDIASKISLSRFAAGKRMKVLSDNNEESLKMKVVNSEWVSRAVDESCDVSNT
jgi:hypothetical protein